MTPRAAALPGTVHHTIDRARSVGVERPLDAPGEVGFAAGIEGVLHRPGHADRVTGQRDPAVEQGAFDPELHGDGHIRGRSDPGIDNDRSVDGL